jgi:cytoskeletal protein CcmA (bactofilin family)
MFSPNQFDESEHLESFLLPADVLFYGDIESANPGRIDGKVSGNVHVASKLFIGEAATISGNISASTVIIQGKVIGNIDCKNKVVICNSAIIHGDILANTIDIKEGSVVNGAVIKRGENMPTEKFIMRDLCTKSQPISKSIHNASTSLEEPSTFVSDELIKTKTWF